MGIEFIGMLEKVPERETQKSSHEELIRNLSLSPRKWFEDKDVLVVVSLV